MKKSSFYFFFISIGLLFSCTPSEKYKAETKTDENGYSYETVATDPLMGRIYTLKNGLKVFLSVNTDEPRIATLIGVAAGSTSDPAETTGLAHYFEHMMFKGTNKIGTIDWSKEEPLLQEISDLFEKHRETTDPAEKLAIYKKIDSVSAIAATFVAANEYDKMVSGIGAKNTNAGTSYDYTVYINDVPKNELQKWLKLESERFGNIVLRLFHTELETVYEEYNMYQDMDDSRANNALMSGLFPTHPYGRDVIGFAEHLKNPSMVNIYNFAKTFYVPNNMVVAISGDIDFNETIKLIDASFGTFEKKELPKIDLPKENPISGVVVKEVFGPDVENVQLAFRFDGDNSNDRKYVTLIDNILSNSKAGLIDLDLVQQQKVLRAGSYSNFLKDYGMQGFYGYPRQGQTLEEVKDLLLAQLEKVKQGEFEEWMLQAIVNDMRLSEIRGSESNFNRVFTYVDAFTKGIPYADRLKFIDQIEKITKEDLVKFANEKYADNYVVVYKRSGQNNDLIKVEKPPITAVPINREFQSEFYKEFAAIQPEEIQPVFVDFDKEIQKSELVPGVDLFYIENKTNEIFKLNYIIDMGKNNNKLFPLAVNYLSFIGTDKFSPAAIQQEFFKLGLSFGVNASTERSYVYITGLSKSFDQGIQLLEHLLSNAKPDQKSYDDYIDGVLKQRADDKLDKNTILWGGLLNYGIYGQNSAFRDVISSDDLKSINPADLTKLIAGMTSFKHKVFYYGPAAFDDAKQKIVVAHKLPEVLNEIPAATVYPQIDNIENQVFVVNYDMAQANILMVSKAAPFDASLIPPAELFDEYFGGGLSSIVFQEIRESRALAYSAFASFSVPGKADRNNIVYGFVGTQADKLKIATDAMLGLMNEMPMAVKQFELAKESIIKKINTERIIKDRIFWTYLANLDQGLTFDNRKDVYQTMQTITLTEFESAFFNKHIKNLKYNFLVLGNKNAINLNTLQKIGKTQELSLDEVFNY
jgi:predicted Zn-dependent peptidase